MALLPCPAGDALALIRIVSKDGLAGWAPLRVVPWHGVVLVAPTGRAGKIAVDQGQRLLPRAVEAGGEVRQAARWRHGRKCERPGAARRPARRPWAGAAT